MVFEPFDRVTGTFAPHQGSVDAEVVEIIVPEEPVVEQGIDREQLLADYINLIDALAKRNGNDSIWWCSEVAARNRFYSPLPHLLSLVVALAPRLQAGVEQGKIVSMRGIPRPVFIALKDLADTKGWRVRSSDGITSSAFEVVVGRLRLVRDSLSHALNIFSRMRLARRFLLSATKIPECSYLIKSFAYISSFQDKSFKDPFFGMLSDHLASPQGGSEDVLTVCLTLKDHAEIFRRMAEVPGGKVLPLECFVTSRVLIRECAEVLGRLCFMPPKSVRNLSFGGYDVSGLVGHVLRTGQFGFSFYQYIHKAAGKKVAQLAGVSICAMTYEAHPWERMFVSGLKECSKDIHVFGCQHSVVPQAAAGVFPGPAEIKSGPLPDTVLTTGQVPRKIIIKQSAFPASRVRDSCALRYDYLYSLTPREGSDKSPYRVLVVLDGTPGVIDLVKYVLDQSRLLPNVVFRIRAHPIAPLEGYLNKLGERLDQYENVESSTCPPVPDDVNDSDAVMYWGSTVALEALMLGRPLINYDRNDMFGYDPLFDFEAYKWTVNRGMPLSDILNGIESLSVEERRQRSKEGREYIRKYFSRATAESLEAFRR